jgi:20S proteasome subunit beta 1
MGTTLLGIRYKDGVIVAADSQTSSGYYISNRAADKITIISDHIICLRSGSSADTQNIVDLVRNITLREQLERSAPLEVRTVAQILRNICYQRKSTSNCSFICAGWDIFHGGQIYTVVQGGTILATPLISSGSGSIFISSFCDVEFRDIMSDMEAEDLSLKAISLAIQRDSNSSGIIRICKISKEGIFKNSFVPSKICKQSI